MGKWKLEGERMEKEKRELKEKENAP